MTLADLVPREAVVPALQAQSKKQVLQELARRAGTLAGLDDRAILEGLLTRERLGSTGFGKGVAIPHVKLHEVERASCLFARLDTAVEFESPDGQPVDLIFLLLSPEHASGDHLKALARISRLVREPQMLARLRAAADAAELYAVLTASAAMTAA
jgi:PTS system nitrogen regulatory IIA component